MLDFLTEMCLEGDGGASQGTGTFSMVVPCGKLVSSLAFLGGGSRESLGVLQEGVSPVDRLPTASAMVHFTTPDGPATEASETKASVSSSEVLELSISKVQLSVCRT